MENFLQALAHLATEPEVAAAVEKARKACEELRWHEAFRRRWEQVRAQSAVQLAAQSARLEGAVVPEQVLRHRAEDWTPTQKQDPALQVGLAALRMELVVVGWMADLPSGKQPTTPAATWPLPQRITMLAAAYGQGGEVPQLRTTLQPQELSALGPAPVGPELSVRLQMLGALWESGVVPAVVSSAILHGEIMALRPLQRGNGLLARVLSRSLMAQRGLDPTGTVGVGGFFARSSNTATYLAGLAGYMSGGRQRLANWVITHAQAVE